MEKDTPTDEVSKGSSCASVISARRKADFAWDHCTEIPSSGKKNIIKCNFCNHEVRGGGINRMKQHLAKIKGQVTPCLKVDADVSFRIKPSLLDIEASKNEKRERTFMTIDEDEEDVDDSSNSKKKKGGIASYMKAGAQIDSTQPSIKMKLQSKEKVHETDMAIAMWFYDSCIPLNAANSPFYEAAFAKTASMGHGYKPPTFHALRVPLLNDAKTQVSLSIDVFRSQWVATGCMIMGDGWTDRSQRSLINFLVYCPSGITFIKSVDVSDIVSSAENLCNLFAEIVQIVGVHNVVQVVTDNASNYKKAGALLNLEYPSIFWSQCSAHCINLIMKDVGELPLVKSLVKDASKITVFVYNHKWPLAWLRKRPGWREIISPGTTSFGTTFIALRSLHEHKQHLEAMVVSNDFKKFLKNNKAKQVKNIILSEKFWNDCLVVVKIMGPIMRLLHLCDTDEKPSLGYVYEGMARAIKGIKTTVMNKESLYKPFVDIVNDRWDRMLRQRLHAAACWLNPGFQYDPECNINQETEPFRGLMEIIHILLPDEPNIMHEIRLFRERQKSFGWPYAKSHARTVQPDEWWKLFGIDAPSLQKLAIRILSQTSSSSGCERNWSVFERIHTKKRNRLEHQRLNDLVFVHYNLRLQHRGKKSTRSYDPINYECIDLVEFWVVDEEPSGELDADELDALIEENLTNAECSQPLRGNEDVDAEVIDEQIDLNQLDDAQFQRERYPDTYGFDD